MGVLVCIHFTSQWVTLLHKLQLVQLKISIAILHLDLSFKRYEEV